MTIHSGSTLPGPDGWISQRGVAEKLGLAYSTIRVYRTRSMLPEPDFMLDGNKPMWRTETIEAHLFEKGS